MISIFLPGLNRYPLLQLQSPESIIHDSSPSPIPLRTRPLPGAVHQTTNPKHPHPHISRKSQRITTNYHHQLPPTPSNSNNSNDNNNSNRYRTRASPAYDPISIPPFPSSSAAEDGAGNAPPLPLQAAEDSRLED